MGAALAMSLGLGAALAPSGVRAADPDPAPVVDQPKVVKDWIPFGPRRQAQMTRFVKRHYGLDSAELTDVKQVVLHFTVSSTYSSINSWFSHNQPAGGEWPQVCSHYAIDKDGTIYQMVRLKFICRHAIGLNHRSIGIEFVEETTADRILDRPAQTRAGVQLVNWLRAKYGIAKVDVIGHFQVNGSRYFEDREGWTNDHVDWRPSQVRQFRRLL